MNIDNQRITIAKELLNSLVLRAESAEKVADNLALENASLRNRTIIAERSLEQLSQRYDVDIRNQLNIRKELESALSKAGARAITAENEVNKLKKERCAAKNVIDMAHVCITHAMRKLDITSEHCSKCNERYCGNCAHANGAIVR